MQVGAKVDLQLYGESRVYTCMVIYYYIIFHKTTVNLLCPTLSGTMSGTETIQLSPIINLLGLKYPKAGIVQKNLTSLFVRYNVEFLKLVY